MNRPLRLKQLYLLQKNTSVSHLCSPRFVKIRKAFSSIEAKEPNHYTALITLNKVIKPNCKSEGQNQTSEKCFEWIINKQDI